MRSNAAKGSYYKSRTRRWLLAQGHQVADMEIVHWVWTPKGRLAIKRDQFGSDLVSMTKDGIIFWQVKGGLQAIGGGTFPAARRVFDEFQWPAGVQRRIIAWAPRARQPRIIECS